jgi:hypothetical protein
MKAYVPLWAPVPSPLHAEPRPALVRGNLEDKGFNIGSQSEHSNATPIETDTGLPLRAEGRRGGVWRCDLP